MNLISLLNTWVHVMEIKIDFTLVLDSSLTCVFRECDLLSEMENLRFSSSNLDNLTKQLLKSCSSKNFDFNILGPFSTISAPSVFSTRNGLSNINDVIKLGHRSVRLFSIKLLTPAPNSMIFWAYINATPALENFFAWLKSRDQFQPVRML